MRSTNRSRTLLTSSLETDATRRTAKDYFAASEIALSSLLRHVIVVDGDEEACRQTCQHFEQHGYVATPLARGSEVQRMLEERRVDLILLDPALPSEDGIQLCRDLRAISCVPIIMVGTLGAASDRIHGLEAGADDYLTKPFNPRELLARSKAVLRRCNQSSRYSAGLTYLFGDWRLATASRELMHKDGEVVRLKKQSSVCSFPY